MNVSQLIRQAVANDNNNFEKVILNVAVGLKCCGFFAKTDWKEMLEECFEKTSTEIELDSSECWDVNNSYDITFANILAETTSSPADPTQIGKRVKRSSTLLRDADILRDTPKKFKKSSSLRDDVKVANIFADLKEANWAQILPTINGEQSAVKYETIFERVKQLREIKTAREVITSSDTVDAKQTVCKPGPVVTTFCNSIRKRRNAFCLPSPSAKRKAKCLPVSDALSAAVPVTESVSDISKKTENSTDSETLDVTLTESNATNVTVKRPTTRSQTPVLSNADTASTNKINHRDTCCFKRTTVLLTMIDALEYQNTLYKYNIFVADINDEYDYVIAERICSPKFLSAVVSGKPVVSVEWIHALNEKNVWLDPLNYLLKDDNGEDEEEAHVIRTGAETSDYGQIYQP